MKRKTRRKEGMPSKELLLVRLHVSGLGLEPRWLLNRLQNTFRIICLNFKHKSSSCQVLKKAADKKSTATVEASKVKEEENLEVAGEKCWRGKWQSALKFTGEIFNRFPMKVIFATVKASQYVVLKLKWKYFSETWILPFTVLFAMVVYTAFAIAYYNKDG